MKQKPDSISVRKISFSDYNIIRSLLGERDSNIKVIEKLESVKLPCVEISLSVTGEHYSG